MIDNGSDDAMDSKKLVSHQQKFYSTVHFYTNKHIVNTYDCLLGLSWWLGGKEAACNAGGLV